jgi:hypothetical protein
MLSVYSNQQDILNSTSKVKLTRFNPVDTSLFPHTQHAVKFVESYSPSLEIHVYTPDGVYLTSNYDASFTTGLNDTTSQNVTPEHISIDLVNNFANLGISRGQYKVIYNVFDNVLGSPGGTKLWIKEISPSRTELRLQLFDNNSTMARQFSDLLARWNTAITNDQFDTYLLNFGANQTYQIVDFKFGGEGSKINGVPEILVKLYNPLPIEFVEKTQVWISEEITTPIAESVLLVPKYVPEVYNTLPGPNFNLGDYEKTSIATDFKSWNDLLGSSLTTSQQLIDSYFPSGSLAGVKLNINYRLFDNFVHFSSATERVENFYYKLQQIEHYSDQIAVVSGVDGGSIAQINLNDLNSKRNAVVSSFDDFEKYLFFESTDTALYSNYDASGSISPWPKTAPTPMTWSTMFGMWAAQASTWSTWSSTATDAYGYFNIQARTDSDAGITYFNNLVSQAQIYDRANIHKLQNSIPTYLLETESETGGDELSLFVHMLGQHFDILWTYINNLTTINAREEHPKDGMPSDLLYHVAASLGFPLLNGKSTTELWNYALGLDSNGSAINNSIAPSIPGSENTKEVWRRIVNNLPYILKSKGTSRSIKALLCCFGIPSTILTIKEYGGPSTFTDNDHYPEYVHDVFHYAWNSFSGSLKLPVNQYINAQGASVYPNTLEFRFKTDSNVNYPIGSTFYVFHASSSLFTGSLQLKNDNGTTGTLTYYLSGSSGSISNISLFDNSWQHVVIDRTNGTGSLKVAKSLYGKTVYLQSASLSLNNLPALRETIYFSPSIYTNRLIGDFHEIRLWSGSLNDETISEHAASAYTYTFDTNKSAIFAGQEGAKPYDHLLQRFSLSSNVINTSSYTQDTIHPNQTINTGSIYFVNHSLNQFSAIEETYYTPSPSLGGSSLYTNKVRIDSASLDTTKRLNTTTRIEKSSLDKYSIDSNRLGIYFSPQNAINEDIFNQLGYFELDDYIGDPADVYNDTFTTLAQFSKAYWKKYKGKNDFEEYFKAIELYDFTLFTYIKRLLPHRSNVISGLVLEPNVLERSKIRIARKPVTEDLKHDAEITNTDTMPTVSGAVSDNGYGIIENFTEIDKLGTSWVQHRFVGKYKITESGSYNPIQTIVLDSRKSLNLYESVYFYSSAASASMNLPSSSSYVLSEVNKFMGTGYDNSRYYGSRLVGSAINVDSPYTIDGGPVVKITKVNPNQLVFAANQITTVNQATTGVQRKTI